MASNDVLSAILHYKRNIEKISDPPERALKYEDRLLHCINKLYRLPVNVNHLQETGIGKTVNALRKIEGEKGLGDAAKALVAKWKTMVMLEDEAERKQREESAHGPSEEDVKKIKLIREAEKSQVKKTEDSTKSPKKHQTENNDKSKSHEDGKKHKSDFTDSRKDRKRKLEHEEGRHHSKHKKKVSGSEESDNVEDNSASEKYSPTYASKESPSKANNKPSEKCVTKGLSSQESSKHEKKKEHKSSSSNASVSSPASKNPSSSSSSHNHGSHDKSESRKSKVKLQDEDGGIDSQSGASFADALGPMVVKKSKKKSSSQGLSNVSSQSQLQTESSNKSNPVKEKKQPYKKIDINRPPADLEPLEPDLIATLPVPTPYYKPSPIYHLPPQEASRRRIQAEEDALNTIMSNKNQRTKVYSGVKGGLSYVPTLYEFCCRVLQQHIDAVEYTGGIPYSLLKPVLDGATPAQLFQFEHFNPYIIEDTDHLWKFHVNKEFRSEQRQEFESWRDMYLRCIDEREEKYKAVTANIQKSLEQSAPVRKAKLAYIDVAKPPRNILRKQIKNGISKPEAARLLGKNDPEAVRVAPPKQPTVREPPSIKVKPKVAPLMQKTLKSIKMTRFKR